MAQYTHLPVYKEGYDLLLKLFSLTKDLPREYKYTVGERIKNHAIDMSMCIYRANSSREKYTYLADAREHIECIRLLVRMLKDLKQIGLKHVVYVHTNIESVSKQLTAWQKSTRGEINTHISV